MSDHDDDIRRQPSPQAAILAEARAGLLTDPLERMVWESGEFTPEERADEIANLRIVRRLAR